MIRALTSIFFLLLFTACAGTPPSPTESARPTLDPNYLTPPPEYRRTPTPRPTPLPVSALGDPVAHIPGTGHNVVVEGDYAYASVGTDWLILDVNDPFRTTPVGRLTLPRPVCLHRQLWCGKLQGAYRRRPARG